MTTTEKADQTPATPEDLLDFFASGGAIRDLRAISDESIEAMYSMAYSLYESGKYQDAHKVFQFLCYLDHYQSKYFIGLGACRQMMKQYQLAIDAFSYASVLDANDPRPPFYGAECHLALGNLKEAESGFTAAIHWANENQEYQSLKQHAEQKLRVVTATLKKQEDVK
ncbi:SycD/LcrH family type III secretion system chaperone [Endozoicomonas sp. SM1973]|uniref:SycD/LcrH family type III secretion system chaperone n=1 Tax=Spartinivicinus marinus TaxID=2994442 RepID=A0A853IFL6_9GAMM|nr:SycD/LcrH family type III secretion system chaperone [Spartinivicinus marinus]MCX4024667.1 SycD/LcrH family type III secretion system chaperone [Spartinivicinus marinus]NYZ66306.1 SycD/LcrH family type III secretion system chaperone [Spartinivicinus marinus]